MILPSSFCLLHSPMTLKAVPFHSKEYWQQRFEKEQHFEWLLPWHVLQPYISSYLNPEEPILHIGKLDARICFRFSIWHANTLPKGCGNSRLAFDLADHGHPRVINVDYASNVIERMKQETSILQKTNGRYSQIEWHTADCLNGDLQRLKPESGYAITIEKSLCDTIACGDDDDQTQQKLLAQQVLLVTRPFGVWISVSFSSERQHVWLSATADAHEWRWERERAEPIKVPQANDHPRAPDIYYWLYILRKVPVSR